jgi:hypothetical protein
VLSPLPCQLTDTTNSPVTTAAYDASLGTTSSPNAANGSESNREINADVSTNKPPLSSWLPSPLLFICGSLDTQKEGQLSDSQAGATEWLKTTFDHLSAPTIINPARKVDGCTDVVYTNYSFLGLGNITSLSPVDLNFLESQACLRVPTREILDEFVQQYFRHVHPFLPILHEGDFWRLYCPPTVDGLGVIVSPQPVTISLLLLQAMLVTSCNVRNLCLKAGFDIAYLLTKVYSLSPLKP